MTTMNPVELQALNTNLTSSRPFPWREVLVVLAAPLVLAVVLVFPFPFIRFGQAGA